MTDRTGSRGGFDIFGGYPGRNSSAPDRNLLPPQSLAPQPSPSTSALSDYLSNLSTEEDRFADLVAPDRNSGSEETKQIVPVRLPATSAPQSQIPVRSDAPRVAPPSDQPAWSGGPDENWRMAPDPMRALRANIDLLSSKAVGQWGAFDSSVGLAARSKLISLVMGALHRKPELSNDEIAALVATRLSCNTQARAISESLVKRGLRPALSLSEILQGVDCYDEALTAHFVQTGQALPIPARKVIATRAVATQTILARLEALCTKNGMHWNAARQSDVLASVGTEKAFDGTAQGDEVVAAIDRLFNEHAKQIEQELGRFYEQ
jgi:hypothetical protein